MLYIIATPIGNLGDITIRALEVLRDVDIIACEDTRRTRTLVTHYDITKPLVSYYEHNKITKGNYLLRLLKEGKDVALVSDSGTPGISDPGFHIVRLALENDISVVPLPGASAVTAALCVAGIPADRFIFEGFLPKKTGARKKRLEQLRKYNKTVVLYESPYRVVRLLQDIKDIFGNVEIAIAREISKRFEEIKKACVDDFLVHFNTVKARGEFVVIINAKMSLQVTTNT